MYGLDIDKHEYWKAGNHGIMYYTSLFVAVSEDTYIYLFLNFSIFVYIKQTCKFSNKTSVRNDIR